MTRERVERAAVGEHVAEQVTAEQAADLARLEGMAAELGVGEPAAGEPADAEPDAPVVDPVESLAGLLGLVRLVGAVGYGRLAAVWGEPECARVAAAAVPVFRKYAWGGRILEFLEAGTGAEEMGLVLVVMQLGAASLAAAREDAAEQAAAANKQRQGPEKAPVRPVRLELEPVGPVGPVV